MSKRDIFDLSLFFQLIPKEETARQYFESRCWENGVSCRHCGSIAISECKNQKPMPYRCRDCRKHFSVRTDTLLEESRLPFYKWLLAIYIMTTARQSISLAHMARELEVTPKTALFLAQRIREAWLISQKKSKKKRTNSAISF